VLWRVLRKSATARVDQSWWRRADEAADAPTLEVIEPLTAGLAPADAVDERERQEEMLEGLRGLLALATAPDLPIVQTQHRVIGTDTCHLVAPAGLVDQVDAPGKLFITSTRVLFAGGRVVGWPWHRVRGVTRHGRDLVVNVAGTVEALHLRCNIYGDALAARYLASRLIRR
jgi:hypothetical protein